MPPTNAFVLARCDRDGKNVYLISANNEPDYLPSVMNDGRVIYTRWEYTDKPLWRAQKLWTINPDGTQVLHYWGNQSVWPDLMKDARSIPGSRRVMFTGSAHHNWFSGSVGIIDPDGGYNFPDGITKVTADVAWPEVGNGPVDPIECAATITAAATTRRTTRRIRSSEQDFLVSAERGRQVRAVPDGRVRQSRADLRRREQHLPRHAAEAASEAAADQRPRGLAGSRAAARLRRTASFSAATCTRARRRSCGARPSTCACCTSTPRRTRTGTSGPTSRPARWSRPCSPKGSSGCWAPCRSRPTARWPSAPRRAWRCTSSCWTSSYRALQTMRSFVGLMPGERRGCLGCHEGHSRAPQVDLKSLAVTKEPPTITPPPWGERHGQLPALRPAGARAVLRQVSSGRRRGASRPST